MRKHRGEYVRSHLSLYGAAVDASGLGRVVAQVICKRERDRVVKLVSQQHRGAALLACEPQVQYGTASVPCSPIQPDFVV